MRVDYPPIASARFPRRGVRTTSATDRGPPLRSGPLDVSTGSTAEPTALRAAGPLRCVIRGCAGARASRHARSCRAVRVVLVFRSFRAAEREA